VVYYLFTALFILVCFVLLLVVLMQRGRAGDIASAFGGSSSQTAFGARAGATMLTKLTAVCAVLFMLGALALAIMAQRGPGSVIRGVQPPPMEAPATPGQQPRPEAQQQQQ
jgi:preprotein translocase subunit SecG